MSRLLAEHSGCRGTGRTCAIPPWSGAGRSRRFHPANSRHGPRLTSSAPAGWSCTDALRLRLLRDHLGEGRAVERGHHWLHMSVIWVKSRGCLTPGNARGSRMVRPQLATARAGARMSGPSPCPQRRRPTPPHPAATAAVAAPTTPQLADQQRRRAEAGVRFAVGPVTGAARSPGRGLPSPRRSGPPGSRRPPPGSRLSQRACAFDRLSHRTRSRDRFNGGVRNRSLNVEAGSTTQQERQP